VAETIFVIAGPAAGNRVALWEVHPAHPLLPGQDAPEVFISGPQEGCAPIVHEVAMTDKVAERLSEGLLIQLVGKDLERAQSAVQADKERAAVLRRRTLLAKGRRLQIDRILRGEAPEDGLDELLAAEAQDVIDGITIA
jgi:hypothetical protein